MKKNLLFLLLISYTGLHTQSWAQIQIPEKTDSIYSIAEYFKRSKIHFETNTLIEYKEIKGVKTKNAENERTIEKIKINNVKYYKVTTINRPVQSENITTVIALLDYGDLHIIQMQLNAKSDSGFVEFSNNQFIGWSQLPKEERKKIDMAYVGFPLVTSDAGINWIAGIIATKKDKKFALSHFALFANTVKWKIFHVLLKEKVRIESKLFNCWKVNAGPMGPPGFVSYLWFETKTGRLIKTELSKEGGETKFVSELKLKSIVK